MRLSLRRCTPLKGGPLRKNDGAFAKLEENAERLNAATIAPPREMELLMKEKLEITAAFDRMIRSAVVAVTLCRAAAAVAELPR